MKIALCLSGHARTFDVTYKYWYSNLISEHNTDVFLHLWDTIGPRKLPAPRQDFDSGIINSSVIDLTEINRLWNPVTMVIEKYEKFHDAFVNITTPVLNERNARGIPAGFEHHHPLSVRSMLYKRFKCNQLKKEYEHLNNFTYDLVIQTRPDVAIVNYVPGQVFGNRDVLYFHNSRSVTSEPEICDYGVIGTSEQVDLWCDLYKNIDGLFDKLKLQQNYFRFLNPHKMYVEYLNEYNQPYIETDLGLCIIRNRYDILGWPYAQEFIRGTYES